MKDLLRRLQRLERIAFGPAKYEVKGELSDDSFARLESALRDWEYGKVHHIVNHPTVTVGQFQVPPEVYGCDLSHWQGAVNWWAFRSAFDGAEDSSNVLAIVKLTEGVDHIDKMAQNYVQGATVAGVPTCGYHFATPFTEGEEDAEAEALHYVKTAAEVGILHSAPFHMLDFEKAGIRLGDLTRGNVNRAEWIAEWVAVVQAHTDRPVVLYTGASTLRKYVIGGSPVRGANKTLSVLPLILARYGNNDQELEDWERVKHPAPDVLGPIVGQQFTSRYDIGESDGIQHKADRIAFRTPWLLDVAGLTIGDVVPL